MDTQFSMKVLHHETHLFLSSVEIKKFYLIFAELQHH